MKVQTVAIHMLTAFPPSNPNRDELNQPKTAVVGGKTRQRISSQCMKRTWRLGKAFSDLDTKYSVRTRELGPELVRILEKGGTETKSALKRAISIAEKFGKVDKKRSPSHSEMVVYGHEEWEAAKTLAEKIAAEDRDPTQEELDGLPRMTQSLDCALFGRMRAATPNLNVDAAVAVSHPLTTNASNVEADFWSSVDDLNKREDSEVSGSGGMGDVEFGSGVYYTYAEVSLPAMAKNLPENATLIPEAVSALLKAMATEAPGGHKTTFGNSVRAAYLRAECGDSSGNLFCSAFEKPVVGTLPAIEALRAAADREAASFGLSRQVFEFSVPEGKSSLMEVMQSVNKAIAEA